MVPHRLHIALALALVFAASLVSPRAFDAAAQQPAGMLASWGDRETWSRHDERANETEVGLGLQPQGPTGPMLLSFSARFPGKVAIKAPESIVAQVGVTPTINPNVLRTPTLVFLLDVKTKTASTFDVSQRMSVDAPGPGAVVNNGRAAMSPEEFARLIAATTLHGKILGIEVEFRRDQLRAMRDFAERLQIRSK